MYQIHKMQQHRPAINTALRVSILQAMEIPIGANNTRCSIRHELSHNTRQDEQYSCCKSKNRIRPITSNYCMAIILPARLI